MPRKRARGENIKRRVVKLAFIVMILLMALLCIFVIFERQRAEQMISRAKHMRLEVTPDEVMIESFSDSVDHIFRATSSKLKSWALSFFGSDMDDVSAQLQTAEMGQGQHANKDMGRADGI